MQLNIPHSVANVFCHLQTSINGNEIMNVPIIPGDISLTAPAFAIGG